MFSFADRTSLCRAEQRAVRWAADWLIGDGDMLYVGQHLAEMNTADQLSEFMRIFCVTREIVILKWLGMKRRGLV
jgi:antirestriction protein